MFILSFINEEDLFMNIVKNARVFSSYRLTVMSFYAMQLCKKHNSQNEILTKISTKNSFSLSHSLKSGKLYNFASKNL